MARKSSDGPGITEVVLETKEGADPDRPPRRQAGDVHLARPARTGRSPCKRRDVPELLAEELRRLDEDDVYAATARDG